MPVSVGMDPLDTSGRGDRQGKVEDRNSLSLAPRDTDGDDAVVRQFDPLDGDGHAENFRREGEREVLLDQRVKTGQLFVVAVGIDGRLGDQGIELLPGEVRPSSGGSGGRRPSRAATFQVKTFGEVATTLFTDSPFGSERGESAIRYPISRYPRILRSNIRARAGTWRST